MEDTARKKLVQKYYSERAEEYDRQKIRTWKSKKGFGAELINEIFDALAGLKDKKVLEVGVGSGRVSFSLLEKVKPWLVGLDISKEMLRLAKAKISSSKREFELVLGDAEHLPFVNEAFGALVCVSTMHYFAFPKKSLTEFSRTLKAKGVFIYGDLMMHELDNNGFLDALEATLSKAHAKYYKLSEMNKLLENHGFHVSASKVFPYRKSYVALMEDKGRYFDVKPKAFQKFIRGATGEQRNLYAIGNDELTLFYMLICALKENKS